MPKVLTETGSTIGLGLHLRMLNEGPADLDGLRVELIFPNDIDKVRWPITGISTSVPGSSSPEVNLGPLRVAETSKPIYLWRTGPMGEQRLRFRCVCNAGKKQWVVMSEIQLSDLEG
jgi:hypothetical protein